MRLISYSYLSFIASCILRLQKSKSKTFNSELFLQGSDNKKKKKKCCLHGTSINKWMLQHGERNTADQETNANCGNANCVE